MIIARHQFKCLKGYSFNSSIMYRTLIYLFLFIPTFLVGQVTFEKGYYINNDSETIEGYIKNKDWKSNPVSIEYKQSLESASIQLSVKKVKEFGFAEGRIYQRFVVDIDDSSDFIAQITDQRNFTYHKDTLLLKAEVKGYANLYSYSKGNLKTFFYSVGNTVISQLGYKKYYDSGRVIREHNYYKQQLTNTLRCSHMSKSTFEKLKYKLTFLKQLFIDFHICNNYPYETFDNTDSKGALRFSLETMIRYARYRSKPSSTSGSNFGFGSFDFGYGYGYAIGSEIEYTLPFRANTWALIIEPRFSFFQRETIIQINTFNPSPETTTANLKYNAINVPVGLRHKIFIGDNKLLISASLNLGIAFNSSLFYDLSGATSFDIQPRPNAIIAVGYVFKDKFQIEFGYDTTKELLSNNFARRSDFDGIHLSVGYSL